MKEISISHWGVFIVPDNKESIPKKRFEPFPYPTVQNKAEYRKYFLDIKA